MSAAAATEGATVRVRQIRSGIGFVKTQKLTLRALGLGKIGKERVHPDNPQIRGMINAVTHLVEIVDETRSA